MVSALNKLGYSARQGARVAWYMGHYFASQRYHKAKDQDDSRRDKPREPGPSVERLMRDLAQTSGSASGVVSAALTQAEKAAADGWADYDTSLVGVYGQGRGGA